MTTVSWSVVAWWPVMLRRIPGDRTGVSGTITFISARGSTLAPNALSLLIVMLAERRARAVHPLCVKNKPTELLRQMLDLTPATLSTMTVSATGSGQRRQPYTIRYDTIYLRASKADKMASLV